MLMETRSCLLDWAQEKRAVAGASARSSSRFLRLFSCSLASRALASASWAFFSSLRFLSASFRFFRLSFSLRSRSRSRSSSRWSLSRRSFLACSCSSSEAAADFVGFAEERAFGGGSFLPGAAAGFDGGFAFLPSSFAALSAFIVSAAFLRPIISPTSTRPFSFFSVVIIFWIILCFSSSARSSSRCSTLAWPMISADRSEATSTASFSDQCERLCFLRNLSSCSAVAGCDPVYRIGGSGAHSPAVMLGGTQ
mmetsp:Transcript_58227/g.182759  ORF Transcript_58227/g.182759 Transcript_58227/m.182759 type:complete len:252 (+) Transcript_58227:631-1386(+)